MTTDTSIPQQFADIKADYAAARPSRFRRTRKGLAPAGSSADYHFRTATDYLKVMETARDMDRNDAIVGQTIDRAVTNTVQGGIKLDVRTGDDKLDKDLAARWAEWSSDPNACDVAGELSFPMMERLALRHQFVDGDILCIGTRSGALQLIEGHRIRNPKGIKNTDNVIHGVKLGPRRERLAYYVTKDDINPMRPAPLVGDFHKFPTRSKNKIRQVFHVFNPRRVSQTRGVSALAPIMDILGMFEDLNFAKLLQAQIVSCFAILREKDVDYSTIQNRGKQGAQTSEPQADGTTSVLEEIRPGMEFEGRPGEKLHGFSPSVPNPEFFDHVKLILTIFGVNVGMPLVLVLMDASETNFSGFRGAVDQARMGFRENQRNLIARLHRPVYLWKLARWIADDKILRFATTRRRIKIDGHGWAPPTWPYIEPMKDAKADQLRMDSGQTSNRRLQAERGRDWDDVAAEIPADNAKLIVAAIKKAEEIRKDHPEMAGDIDWHELLPRNMRKGPAQPAAATAEKSREAVA